MKNDNNNIIDKLYLNPIKESNYHRNKNNLNPLKQKEVIKTHLKSSNSVPDLFLNNLNGQIIMQNWNTKKSIPKDIGESLNLPIFNFIIF